MNPNPSPLIAISVGEASGDLLGAHLIRAIKARCPNVTICITPSARLGTGEAVPRLAN